MKRICYLAGPMSGFEEYNFPAFRREAQWLRLHGMEVISPEELESKEEGPRKAWEYYLKRDLVELMKCNTVAVLPGWQDSRGATLEVYVGWRLGFEIIDAKTLEKVDVSGYDFNRIQSELDWTPTNTEAFTASFGGKTHNAIRDIAEGNKLVTNHSSKALLENGEKFFDPSQTIYPKDKTPNILEEANALVGGDRAKAYGHPKTDFDRTAKIWEAVLGIKVDAYQVALCMIGVKISRECNARKRDNAVDMAGYAQTLAMVNEKEGKY